MRRHKRLSATFVRTVTRPGRYGDGRGGYGLCLNVKPNSAGGLSKAWAQRVRIQGKPTYLGLGPYPVVTLAEARVKALEHARLLAKGIDPRTGGVPTFKQAAEQHIHLNEPNWKRGARTANIERARLELYVYPKIGRKRIHKVTTVDLMGCLLPIWNTKRETARRVKQRIAAVLEYSIAKGFRDDNPATALAAALPKNGTAKRHHKALHYSRVADAIATVRGSGAHMGTRLAFEFMVLTAARSGEVRLATWDEVDLDTALWTIPASRMKAKREHRVPLSPRAVSILQEAAEYSDGSRLIFPSATGRTMSDSTLSKLLRENGVEGVPHGFRSSFRDYAAEQTNAPRAVMEAALAHVVGGTEGAYFRSDVMQKRRKLMVSWEQYLAHDTQAKLVQFPAS